jgi:hypothetical protein
MLSDRERSYLRRFRWWRRAAIVMGLLLTLAGGCYALWGAGQFRSDLGIELGQERSVGRWDPPARLALLFAPYHERLREAEPETEAESILLEELDEQTMLTARLLVLLIRILFASLVLTTGLILISSGLANRRLLAILDSVLEQQQRPRSVSAARS